MKLSELAIALSGRLVGDGDPEVRRAVPPAEATEPGDIALAMDKRLVPQLKESPCRLAVVATGTAVAAGTLDAWIEVDRPRLAMALLTEVFDLPVRTEAGIHPTAVIAPDARLGEGVCVGAFSVVGHEAEIGAGSVIMSQVTVGAAAKLGAGCLIHPGARIGDRVAVGDRVILHHNVSLGADGFSFVTPEPGSVESAKATGQVASTNRSLRRINSIGTVVIGDEVEIGANTAIDRGTVSATRVGRGTKIDNLVQIGHNVQIGEGCMICGQVGIAGSAVIGNRVVLAGQVGVADHIKIGDDAVVGAKSAVGSDVAPRSVVMGIPAAPRERTYDQLLHLGRLKWLFGEVAALKERLKMVENRPEKD